MNEEAILLEMFNDVRDHKITPEEALEKLKTLCEA